MSSAVLSSEQRPSRRWVLPIIAVVVLSLAGLLSYYIRDLMGHSQTAKKPPKISLMTPPAPPPPPPPPKFEKKPEPPKEQKEIKMAQPVQKVDSPPPAPSNDLKMDGPAGNGPSAFGSGTITSEDLSKFSASGKPGGTGTGAAAGMFNPYTNYTNLAKGELQRYLSKREALRRKRYALEVHLWVAPTGAVNRFELVGRSGDSEIDEVISQAMAAMPSLSQALPAHMPMPIRLRITTGA